MQEPLEPLLYAYMALGTSFFFQASSAIRAFYTLRQRARAENCSMFTYLCDNRDPSVNVVLLEDCAALTGVCIALAAITASAFTGTPFWDSCGSIGIGMLLGGVASTVIKLNSQHLVGRSIPYETRQRLIALMREDRVVSDVHDVKATVIGPDEVRLKAEIDFAGSEITAVYLDDLDMPALVTEVRYTRDTHVNYATCGRADAEDQDGGGGARLPHAPRRGHHRQTGRRGGPHRKPNKKE